MLFMEPQPCTATLGEVFEQCMRAKEASNLRPCYVRELRRVLRQFCDGRETQPIKSVTVAEVGDWIDANAQKPGTRATLIARLSALFSFAFRRSHVDSNPVARIDRVRLERSPPTILTPQQAGELIRATTEHSPELLAYVALGLYCGVRPAELKRLDWACIDLARGMIRVDAAASKVRRRRLIQAQPIAVHWLSKAPKQQGAVAPLSHVRPRRRIERALGWERWPHDLLRHTAASYLLALHRDAGKVAMMLGNSPGILLNHYHELVSPEDCARFWAL
jgi:integrase